LRWIIDEVGYPPPLGSTGAFQRVAARFERGSILFTGTQSFREWGDVVGDRVIATAILDPLLHHSHVLNV
jgi:DNA replication protein DnaC